MMTTQLSQSPPIILIQAGDLQGPWFPTTALPLATLPLISLTISLVFKLVCFPKSPFLDRFLILNYYSYSSLRLYSIIIL